jgi:hypothetical protein
MPGCIMYLFTILYHRTYTIVKYRLRYGCLGKRVYVQKDQQGHDQCNKDRVYCFFVHVTKLKTTAKVQRFELRLKKFIAIIS